MAMTLDASLDTSFWNRASEIGVAPYLFHFFRVHYCDAIRLMIPTKTIPKPATIAKTIRLSPEESAELGELSEQSEISETILLKRWVRQGMQAERLERAIQAYLQRRIDLRGGAKQAGLSYNHFMREIEARNIVILEDDGHFLDRLSDMADSFDLPILREAIKKVTAEQEIS